MTSIFYRLSVFVATGHIEKWKQDWWPRADKCSVKGGDDDGVLHVGDVLGIFLILIIGNLLKRSIILENSIELKLASTLHLLTSPKVRL